MVIKNIDDIERERKDRDKEKLKSDITNDIDDVVKEMFKKFKIDSNKRKTEKKKNEHILIKILKFLAVIGVGILVLNFLLANIWLFKYFIKSLFGL